MIPSEILMVYKRGKHGIVQIFCNNFEQVTFFVMNLHRMENPLYANGFFLLV